MRQGLAAVLGAWGVVASGRVILGDDDLALLPVSAPSTSPAPLL
jgi:hypothetical protein